MIPKKSLKMVGSQLDIWEQANLWPGNLGLKPHRIQFMRSVHLLLRSFITDIIRFETIVFGILIRLKTRWYKN